MFERRRLQLGNRNAANFQMSTLRLRQTIVSDGLSIFTSLTCARQRTCAGRADPGRSDSHLENFAGNL